MKLYLDSSVLVAAFSPDVLTDRALDILALSPEVVISEPTHISLIRDTSFQNLPKVRSRSRKLWGSSTSNP